MIPSGLPPGVLVEEVTADGGPRVFLVLDPESPSWTYVNEDGLETLILCDGKRSVEGIVRALSDQYPGADGDAVLEAVGSFLHRIQKSRILQPEAPEEATAEAVFNSLALEITARCNLRCTHCYLSAGDPHPDELSFSEICRVLDEAKASGGASVAIGGGEPLLRGDWRQIVEYALSADLMVSVGTNGTLIDAATAEWLSGLPVKVQISLDGARAEVHDLIRGRGSFFGTTAGIQHLLKAGKAADIVIAFTPMQPNFRDVPAIVEFALDHGIPVVQFPPLSLSGRADHNAQDLFLSDDQTLQCWEWIRDRAAELRGQMDLLADCFSMNVHRPGVPVRCSIGTQLRVDPSGDVYPCQCFHSGEDFRLGNVRETSLGEMVAGHHLAEIKRISYGRRNEIPECRACRVRNYCGGGCMAKAYDHHRTVYRPADCDVRKGWIEGLLMAECP